MLPRFKQGDNLCQAIMVKAKSCSQLVIFLAFEYFSSFQLVPFQFHPLIYVMRCCCEVFVNSQSSTFIKDMPFFLSANKVNLLRKKGPFGMERSEREVFKNWRCWRRRRRRLWRRRHWWRRWMKHRTSLSCQLRVLAEKMTSSQQHPTSGSQLT